VDSSNANSAAVFTLTDNGRTETFGASGVSRLLIELGNGNDLVTVDGSDPADLAGDGPMVYVQDGSGNDGIDVDLVNVNAVVTAGDGNDSAVVRGSNDSISVTLGNGNDTLTAAASGGSAHSVNLIAGTGQDVYTNNDPAATVQSAYGNIDRLTTTIIGHVDSTQGDFRFPEPDVLLETNGTVTDDGYDIQLSAMYRFGNLPAGASYHLVGAPPAYNKVLQPASGEYDTPVGSLITGYNFLFTSTVSKLNGTVVGTAGSFRNAGHTIAAAVDGKLSTYFDGPDAVGDWVGFDFGSPVVALAVKYAPRGGYADRMIGGQIQASNTADFSSGVVQLYSVGVTQSGVLTTQRLVNHAAFRYYRYFGPLNGFCDIAELEFDG
jgi:hypothetical protein